jgi:hypothetical protein
MCRSEAGDMLLFDVNLHGCRSIKRRSGRTLPIGYASAPDGDHRQNTAVRGAVRRAASLTPESDGADLRALRAGQIPGV